MAIVTNNQKPVILNSTYTGNLANTFNPFETIRDEVIQNLFSPLTNGIPVTIEKDGKSLSKDDITSILLDCCGDTVDPTKEDIMKEIFSQTLAYYDKKLSVQDVYAVQAAKQWNVLLPVPQKVIYTEADVIDAAKHFLSGQINKDQFFANISFYARIQTFGYYFANAAAWEEFKVWFANEINAIQNLIPPETQQLCQDLQNIKLHNLTESFVIRDDDTQNNDPYSFARLFVFYLMLYETHITQNKQPEYIAGHMPFAFGEHFCPRTIVILNVEKHAHAHVNQIKNEWNMIHASMNMKPRVLNRNQLVKLTAMARMSQKMSIAGGLRQSAMKARSAIIRFRKTAPTSVDLYKHILKIYKQTRHIQHSENAVKNHKMSFNRPSRRNPDNPDIMGKVTTTAYKPDLHVYLDCSGSISEREYQDAIKACIKLAKKMNINFYFNSFSDIMSSCVKLHTANKTPKQIYNEFKNTPKVAGGTDYEQIWHYINRSKKLGQEVSLIISDFEYWAPNHYVKHPRFLYYAPISSYSWNAITEAAKNFCKTMLNICPNIRKHLLM